MRRASRAIVVLILGFVLYTRWMGAHEGLPYLYHWDEVITSTSALNILKTGDIRPKDVDNVYGGFLRYSSLAIDTGYYFHLKRKGQVVSTKDIKTNLDGDYRTISHPQFYFINRIFCVLLSVSCIWLCYKIARLFEPEHYIAGVAAVLMLSISYHYYEESRFTLPNVTMAFWTLFILFFSLRYNRSGKLSHLFLGLIGSGMAAATKLSGALTLVLPLISLIRYLPKYRAYPIGKKILGIVILGITPLIAFLFWTPSIFVDHEEWLRWNQWQVREYSDPNTGQFKKHPGLEHFTFQMKLVSDEIGPSLFLCSVLGALLLCLSPVMNKERSTKEQFLDGLLLVGFPILYVFYFTQKIIAYHRNFMVIYPFMAVWFGIFVQRCANGLELSLSKFTKIHVSQLALLLIFATAFVGLHLDRYRNLFGKAEKHYQHMDTRTQAIQIVNDLISRKYKGAGVVGIAHEVKVSTVDLKKLNVPYRLFEHIKIDEAYHQNTILLVGEYQSFHLELRPGDDRLNQMTKRFALLRKVEGSTLFRDTKPPESQSPHINPAVYILEGASVEEAYRFPLVIATLFDSVSMYINSDYEFFDSGLLAGRYEISFVADGTPALNEFPRVEIVVGDAVIHSTFLTTDTAVQRIRFVCNKDGRTMIKVRFVNDYADGKEDRNVFIKSMELVKINE